jgi:hypothetical protein
MCFFLPLCIIYIAMIKLKFVKTLRFCFPHCKLLQVVVMRVSIHCQGCAGKVKKHLSKMEGYNIDHLIFLFFYFLFLFFHSLSLLFILNLLLFQPKMLLAFDTYRKLQIFLYFYLKILRKIIFLKK